MPCVMTMGSTITVGLFAYVTTTGSTITWVGLFTMCDNSGEHHNLWHGKAARRRVQLYKAALMEAQRLSGVCEKPQPEGETAS